MLARPGFVPLARPAFYSFIFVVGAGTAQVAQRRARRPRARAQNRRTGNRNGPFGTVV